METAWVKARLNLYAVMQNFEELVRYDPESAAMTADWDISLQFAIRGGDSAHLEFRNGRCRFSRGPHPSATISLYFLTPGHFNAMMDGKAPPVPLRGLFHIRFLTGDFQRLSDRLEYYLKPTEERMADAAYRELNTRMSLNSAAFSVREIALGDPIGRLNAAHMPPGAVVLNILPDGPSVHIRFTVDDIIVEKTGTDNPMARLEMKDMTVASDFLNGKLDSFAAIAAGEVAIRGQIPMLDALSNILDRIPHYLG
ncbi:MAG: hypothetical protein ABIL58_11665 [Pseudomonadota bacterium]